MWDWSKNQIEIIFLRHGMTIENEQHRYLGNTDTSLSRNGICKLQAVAEKRNLSKDGYSVLQSDEALHRNRRNPLSNHKPIYIPEWREMDFGEFEGKELY